jgi:hypothetical protein
MDQTRPDIGARQVGLEISMPDETRRALPVVESAPDGSNPSRHRGRRVELEISMPDENRRALPVVKYASDGSNRSRWDGHGVVRVEARYWNDSPCPYTSNRFCNPAPDYLFRSNSG